MADTQPVDTGSPQLEINENFGPSQADVPSIPNLEDQIKQPVAVEEAPLPEFPQRFPEQDIVNTGSGETNPQFKEEPLPENIVSEKVEIKTINDLLDDQDALRRWVEEEDSSVKDIVLGRLNPDFDTADIGTKQMIRNKLEMSLIPEWKEIPLKALKNLVPNTIKVGTDIFKTFMDLGGTAEGLQNAILGAFARLVPGDQEGLKIPFLGTVSEDGAKAIGNFFIERYGGIDNLKLTMANTPAEFLTDLSSVISGGASVLGKVGLVRVGNELVEASTAGKVVQGVGKGAQYIDPINLGGKVIGKGAEVLKDVARSRVQTLLPNTKVNKGNQVSALTESDKLADELLLTPHKFNRRSISNIKNRVIKPLVGKIRETIARGDREGRFIKTKETVRLLDKTIDDLGSIRTNPFADEVNTLKKIREEILSGKGTLGGRLDKLIVKKTRFRKSELGDKGKIRDRLQSSIRDNNKKLQGVLSPKERRLLKRENEVLGIIKEKVKNTKSRQGISQSQLDDIVEKVKTEESIITLSEAQKLKEKLNTVFTKGATEAIDAIKKVAKDKVRTATKDLIEFHFPELRGLNQELNVALELRQAIAQAVRESVESSPGISSLAIGFAVGGGTGYVSGGTAGGLILGLGGAATVYAADKILTNANVRLRIARAMDLVAAGAGTVAEGASIGRPTFQAGRIADFGEEPLSENDEQLANEIGGL